MNMRPHSTSNASDVHAVLKAAGRALSAYEILDQLRGTSIRAPTQVYRALQQLQAMGEVHRIYSLNAFIACAAGHHDSGRPGLLICRQCNRVFELDVPAVESLPAQAGVMGFVAQSVVLEVAGLCEACRHVCPA